MQSRGGQILLVRVSFLVGFLNQWFHLTICLFGICFYFRFLCPHPPCACPGRPPRTRTLPGSSTESRPFSGSPLLRRAGKGEKVPRLHQVASPLALHFPVAKSRTEKILVSCLPPPPPASSPPCSEGEACYRDPLPLSSHLRKS